MLRISGDGSLRPVPDGVVSSGGVPAVSVAVHDNLVYVANAGNGGNSYTGFRLRHDGRLTPIADSTVAMPDASQPATFCSTPMAPSWREPASARP